MREKTSIFANIDWITVLLFFLIVLIGWINIYAAVYNEEHSKIFDLSQRYGKQMIWILASLLIILIILLIDAKFFSSFAYVIYGLLILSLIAVLLVGKEVAGSRSWFQLGSFGVQPSEFAKFATALALAKYLSTFNVSVKKAKSLFISLLIILLPAGLIFLQNDTGSAVVYISFLLVLYREGLSGVILVAGIAIVALFLLSLLINNFILIGILLLGGILFLVLVKRTKKLILTTLIIFLVSSLYVLSVNHAFDNFLSDHQKTRIKVLIGTETDVKGAGYNVHQSKIAIGSGGFSGKGFLKGTQTKYNFVPEQDTDFIFCTIGEEWGFIGSFIVIGLFMILFYRLIVMAERQKSNFARIYGYGVISVLFFHFLVNIGMAIGIVPVIGIPLPFISYGGSSLWSFAILLFIFIRLDAHRWQLL